MVGRMFQHSNETVIDRELPVDVRWTSDLDQLERPAQGWTFFPDEPFFEGMTWRDYVVWVVSGGQAVRIWIGRQLVWRKGSGWIGGYRRLNSPVMYRSSGQASA